MSAEARPAPLIGVRELAALLGWKLTRTYEADRSGAIPGRVVINGRIWYRRRVVDGWLAGEDANATLRLVQQRTADSSAVRGG